MYACQRLAVHRLVRGKQDMVQVARCPKSGIGVVRSVDFDHVNPGQGVEWTRHCHARR